MIYKKYEFSLSLNGDEVMNIARNASGIVVFRARSVDELKDLIDASIYDAEQAAAAEARKKAEAEEKKLNKAKRGFFSTDEEQVVQDENQDPTAATENESILVPQIAPQTRVTRGPDGKFISKSTLDTEETKKKGFWEKITS